MQVLYIGRAPRTKKTLPDFREKCRVTRHSRVFCGLTDSQRSHHLYFTQINSQRFHFIRIVELTVFEIFEDRFELEVLKIGSLKLKFEIFGDLKFRT